MPIMRKIAKVAKECVACGCCVKVCPKEAIAVHKGVYAVVNSKACVGCGKCVKICPADVILLREVSVCEEAVV